MCGVTRAPFKLKQKLLRHRSRGPVLSYRNSNTLRCVSFQCEAVVDASAYLVELHLQDGRSLPRHKNISAGCGGLSAAPPKPPRRKPDLLDFAANQGFLKFDFRAYSTRAAVAQRWRETTVYLRGNAEV